MLTYLIRTRGITPQAGWNIDQLSIAYAFRHGLRAASPVVDCQCHGNLGFSGFQFLIGIVVTHANIFTSHRSSRPHGSTFSADENALLPRMGFTEEVNLFTKGLPFNEPYKLVPTGQTKPPYSYPPGFGRYHWPTPSRLRFCGNRRRRKIAPYCPACRKS